MSCLNMPGAHVFSLKKNTQFIFLLHKDFQILYFKIIYNSIMTEQKLFKVEENTVINDFKIQNLKIFM